MTTPPGTILGRSTLLMMFCQIGTAAEETDAGLTQVSFHGQRAVWQGKKEFFEKGYKKFKK